jgi:hypothetical protein
MTDDAYRTVRERMSESRQRRANTALAEDIIFQAMSTCVDRGIELKQIEEALRNSIQLVQEPPQVVTIDDYKQFVGGGLFSSTTKI